MFGIFKNTKVKLNLALDRQVYRPGDVIHAHITLQNDEEMNIQGLRFTIICQQKYQYRRKSRDSDGDTLVNTTWGKNDVEVFRFDFLPETSLLPDNRAFDTSFTLEESALPTSKGEIVSTAWFAKATLDRKHAADTNSEVEFTVVNTTPPGAVAAAAVEYGASNEPAEAQMSYYLKTKAVAGGDVLSGSLRILPQKNFSVSEVRLEFVRVEYVADVSRTGYDHQKEIQLVKKKLAGKTQLSAGQFQEFPFSLEIPQALAPSMQFDVASLKYQLKGVLARTLRKDTLVEEEIVVYSSR